MQGRPLTSVKVLQGRLVTSEKVLQGRLLMPLRQSVSKQTPSLCIPTSHSSTCRCPITRQIGESTGNPDSVFPQGCSNNCVFDLSNDTESSFQASLAFRWSKQNDVSILFRVILYNISIHQLYAFLAFSFHGFHAFLAFSVFGVPARSHGDCCRTFVRSPTRTFANARRLVKPAWPFEEKHLNHPI